MGRPRAFDYDRATEMSLDGCTIEFMMRELGCSRFALYSFRHRYGLPKVLKAGPKRIDDEKVAELSARGWTRREIAKELGCCLRTVERSRSRSRIKHGVS